MFFDLPFDVFSGFEQSIFFSDQIVHDFDDPSCLRSHDKATQVDAEKIKTDGYSWR